MTTREAVVKKSVLAEVAPFVAPFFVFMVVLSIEGYFLDWHYVFYPVKALLVAAILAWYWRSLPSLRPAAPLLSVAVGVLGILIWVGCDPWALRLNALMEELLNRGLQLTGLDSWQIQVDSISPAGRNPFVLYPATEAWVLFAFRLLGITFVVPVMEELFWRGFLMRWLIQEDFTAVPLGTYQRFSFGITTAFFAAVHGPEWPLAVVVGLLYGTLFVRTKSLGNIMLAHGVTNLLLILYCLISNDWHFLSVAVVAHALK